MPIPLIIWGVAAVAGAWAAGKAAEASVDLADGRKSALDDRLAKVHVQIRELGAIASGIENELDETRASIYSTLEPHHEELEAALGVAIERPSANAPIATPKPDNVEILSSFSSSESVRTAGHAMHLLNQFGQWFPSNPLTAPLMLLVVPLVGAVTAAVVAVDSAAKVVSAVKYRGDLKQYNNEIEAAEKQALTAAAHIEKMKQAAHKFNEEARSLVAQAADREVMSRRYQDLAQSDIAILQKLALLYSHPPASPHDQ